MLKENEMFHINLQLLAEGDPVVPPVDPPADPPAPNFDDVLKDKNYQAEFDRRIAKALETNRSKLEKEFEDRLAGKLSEAEKMAKMNAEQKAQYEREQAEAKIAQRESEITKRELRAEAKETLATKGLPVELADTLNYTDADSCSKSLEAVEKAFNASVEKSVNDKLRGNPPKAGDDNNEASKTLPKVF